MEQTIDWGISFTLKPLYHIRCGACDTWWSNNNKRPTIGSRIFCPDCGVENLVTEIENEMIPNLLAERERTNLVSALTLIAFEHTKTPTWKSYRLFCGNHIDKNLAVFAVGLELDGEPIVFYLNSEYFGNVAAAHHEKAPIEDLDKYAGFAAIGRLEDWIQRHFINRNIKPEASEDLANHPLHYQTVSSTGFPMLRELRIPDHLFEMECREALRALERSGWDFSLLSAAKYLWRCDNKGQLKQDLEKALWYLQDFIANYDVTSTPDALVHNAKGAIEMIKAKIQEVAP